MFDGTLLGQLLNDVDASTKAAARLLELGFLTLLSPYESHVAQLILHRTKLTGIDARVIHLDIGHEAVCIILEALRILDR